MKALKKILIFAFGALAANLAQAQTQAPCAFNQASFAVNFGTIVGPKIAKTQSVVSLTCTAGLPYNFSIGAFPIQDGNKVTTYKDASYTTTFNVGTAIYSSGTGATQEFPLYFKFHRGLGSAAIDGEYPVRNVGTGFYSQNATLTITF